ncbi:Uncharacterised protein [Comamonas aquatica]|jgi:hypothetical protein|nr:Uncharacterised protein [Comamonas aquatica]CAC9209287.1 Uncharacterised protein [Comamonas aquatica]
MLMSNDYFRRQPSLQTLRRTTVASLKQSPDESLLAANAAGHE